MVRCHPDDDSNGGISIRRRNDRYRGNVARPRRFERPTPAFGGQYSIQLSYGREEDAKHSVFR